MEIEKLEKLRREYSGEELREDFMDPDPIRQFEIWFNQALSAGVSDPHAMTLATVSPDGTPSARVVLLRGVSPEGFTFYTNYDSRKSKEVLQSGKAAIVFYWRELDRQVRLEGTVSKGDDPASDRYFASRPRESQIAAWASAQSRVISSREELEKLFNDFAAKFLGREVPRPENWGGFLVRPTSMEFWQGRPSRLHDRIQYTINGSRWEIRRLAP